MTTKPDPSQAVQFLKVLFRPDDLIVLKPIESWVDPTTGTAESRVIWSAIEYIWLGVSVPNAIDPRQSKWVYLPDEEIKRQLQPLFHVAASERANIYFGVCPRFGRGGKYELAWQTRRVNGLWVDVDNVTVTEVAKRCSAAGLPRASVIVSSGGGVHLYWRFEEAYQISDAMPQNPPPVETEWISGAEGKRRKRMWFTDPQTGARLIYSPATRPSLSEQALHLQDTLSGLAAAIGGDSTHDLPRIMRLPGTWNRKDERNGRQPRPCTLVHCEPSCPYPSNQFACFADNSTTRRERAAIKAMRVPPKKDKITSGRGGFKAQRRFDDLINDCAAAEIGTRSHADFALCCAAIEQGWPKDEVWASASQVGKIAERGEEYFHLTWDKAKQHVRERIYHRHRERQQKRLEIEADKSNSETDQSVLPLGSDKRHGPHNENNAELADAIADGKPEVPMFGSEVTVTSTVNTFGELLGKTCRFFRRGGVVQRAVEHEHGEPSLQIVKPASLPFDLEAVARVVDLVTSEDGGVFTRPTTCSESQARIILESPGFLEQLPPIRVISPCPVLVEIAGKLVQVHGYNRECGVLAYGPEIHIPQMDEAKALLGTLTSQFRYVSEHDRSRHLASLITPALIHGQLLGVGKRVPMDLTESDESQTGKGFRNNLTAAIYNQEVETIKQRRAGVGSIEEEFDKALVTGRQFICFDNVRGQVDLPALESYLTESRYTARFAHSPPIAIDAAKNGTTIMFTSNAADMTVDLANRSSIVRILKQHDDFEFVVFREGDLLDHVRTNWTKFLGAVFAVIKQWHSAGKPQIPKPDHSFRHWAATLGWIVRNVLDAKPLLEGHREAQQRVATPHMKWLRDVAMVVKRADRLDEWLRAHELVDMLNHSDIPIPGMKPDTDLEDEQQVKKVHMAMGKRLFHCFGKRRGVLVVDRFQIERDETKDAESRPRKVHRFSLIDGDSAREPQPDLASESTQDGTSDSSVHDDAESEVCDDGGLHIWETTTESDGKTRRFCIKCKYFGGFVDGPDSTLF